MTEDRKLTEGRLHQEFHDKKRATEKEIVFLSELTAEQAAEIHGLRETVRDTIQRLKECLSVGCEDEGGTMGRLHRAIRHLEAEDDRQQDRIDDAERLRKGAADA